MLTKDEVQHIAQLARIGVTDEEVEKYQKELSAILDYFEQLKEVDTENVDSIGHITGMENIYREDTVQDFGNKGKKEILENAPETKDDYIQVKSVF